MGALPAPPAGLDEGPCLQRLSEMTRRGQLSSGGPSQQSAGAGSWGAVSVPTAADRPLPSPLSQRGGTSGRDSSRTRGSAPPAGRVSWGGAHWVPRPQAARSSQGWCWFGFNWPQLWGAACLAAHPLVVEPLGSGRASGTPSKERTWELGQQGRPWCQQWAKWSSGRSRRSRPTTPAGLAQVMLL